jgi:hypothetical protein
MIFEEMKKAKCLPIWSYFDKFAQGTITTNKLNHKRKRGGLI